MTNQTVSEEKKEVIQVVLDILVNIQQLNDYCHKQATKEVLAIDQQVDPSEEGTLAYELYWSIYSETQTKLVLSAVKHILRRSV